MSLDYFTMEVNRSERAKQTNVLAPKLANKDQLLAFLTHFNFKNPVTRAELESVQVLHFVWVLRDQFSEDRENCSITKNWGWLVEKWVNVLNLPEWANDINWWRHPHGIFKGDTNYVVHPCSKEVGWTVDSIKQRVPNASKDQIDLLLSKRKIINTECDCFIQTSKRSIIVECKDKTSFNSNQKKRQEELFDSIQRLYSREYQIEYIEVANRNSSLKQNRITWKQLAVADIIM